jgi:CheY-like chemotaxis protein
MHRALNPRLILMDVSMPDMNGYEATRAIRASEAVSGHRIPIIGVTAHALKGDREKCLDSGMDDYLPKPVSPDRLAAKIGNWLGETLTARTG